MSSDPIIEAGRSIPFIIPEAPFSEKFKLSQEAVTFLRSLKNPLAPVCIVGKYRYAFLIHCGKQHITSFLLRQDGKVLPFEQALR